MKKILSISIITILMFSLISCQKQNEKTTANNENKSVGSENKKEDTKEYAKEYLLNVNSLFGSMPSDYKAEVNAFKEGGATNWTIQPDVVKERLDKIKELTAKVRDIDTKNNEKCLEIQKISLDILQSMTNTVNARLIYSTEKDKNKVNDAFNKEIGQIKKNTEKIQKLIDYKIE
jgi:hypothetical protein